MATLPNIRKTVQDDQLSLNEKTSSHKKERKSWSGIQVFVRVYKYMAPAGSNVIGLHVVYRRKADGTPKDSIVPWRHRDTEKDDLRYDAPFSLDSIMILLSLVAEHKWTVCTMDLMSACLQAKAFNWYILARPPRKE